MSSLMDTYKETLLKHVKEETEKFVKEQLDELNSQVMRGDIDIAFNTLDGIKIIKNKETDIVNIINVETKNEKVCPTQNNVIIEQTVKSSPSSEKVEDKEQNTNNVAIGYTVDELESMYSSNKCILYDLKYFRITDLQNVIVQEKIVAFEDILTYVCKKYASSITQSQINNIRNIFNDRLCRYRRSSEYIGSGNVYIKCNSKLQILQAADIVLYICTKGEIRIRFYFE